MIEHIAVRNFQSLHHIDLPLGRFTVIVGPSSSGKTALMRALRGLASNVRGTAVITQGKKTMAVTARTGEATITLQRSESRGEYRISRIAADDEVYTKLAGAVPAEVTAALGIMPAPGPNFASQFDAPYLLDESGAAVARILGELTNVHAIFEAVAEANRRKRVAAPTLKTRQEDLAAVQEAVRSFGDVPARLAALERAERCAALVAALTKKTDGLRQMIDWLTSAEKKTITTTLKPLPDGLAMRAVADQRHAAVQAVRAWYEAGVRVQRGHASYQESDRDVATARQAVTAALHAAGRCPTCGQTTSAAQP